MEEIKYYIDVRSGDRVKGVGERSHTDKWTIGEDCSLENCMRETNFGFS